MTWPAAVVALAGLMVGLALILFGVAVITARRRQEARGPDRRRDGDAGSASDSGARAVPGDDRSPDCPTGDSGGGDGGGSGGGSGGDGGGGGGGGD